HVSGAVGASPRGERAPQLAGDEDDTQGDEIEPAAPDRRRAPARSGVVAQGVRVHGRVASATDDAVGHEYRGIAGTAEDASRRQPQRAVPRRLNPATPAAAPTRAGGPADRRASAGGSRGGAPRSGTTTRPLPTCRPRR